MAVSTCEPFTDVVVFQVVVNGALVSAAPRFTPFNWNCTLATETLSVAMADTVCVPGHRSATGAVIATVGALGPLDC